MRKLFLIFLFFNQLYAELILEITQGTDDPYRVAILPFSGDTEMSEELESIIKNNLIISYDGLERRIPINKILKEANSKKFRRNKNKNKKKNNLT